MRVREQREVGALVRCQKGECWDHGDLPKPKGFGKGGKGMMMWMWVVTWGGWEG